MTNFSWRQKIYFPYNTFVSYICYKEIFFQKHIKMELKMVLSKVRKELKRPETI